MRELGIKVIKHGLRRAWAYREVARDGRLDTFLAFGRELLLIDLAPNLLVDEIGSEAGNRLLFPMSPDLLWRPIARRIVGGRVVS